MQGELSSSLFKKTHHDQLKRPLTQILHRYVMLLWDETALLSCVAISVRVLKAQVQQEVQWPNSGMGLASQWFNRWCTYLECTRCEAMC